MLLRLFPHLYLSILEDELCLRGELCGKVKFCPSELP